MRFEDIFPTRDYSPKTPSHMLKEFLEGTIHEDFLRELNLRIEDMRDVYEECDSKAYLETRGGLKAMRMVAGIFHDLYGNSIDDSRKEKRNVR